MNPRLGDLTLHVLRVGGSMAALALAPELGPAPAAGAAFAVFFASFALMHDLAHGALRLPRRVNEVALSLSGALLLMSGHALRLSHLRHHARCLDEGDHEGAPARWSLRRAVLLGPGHALALRASTFRLAGRAGRRWQLGETAVNAACFAALLASGHPALLAYAAAAMAAQLSMAVWAAHLPHNAPPWLARAAAQVARIGSVVALSLAFHERHHARPEIPCARLAPVACTRDPG